MPELSGAVIRERWFIWRGYCPCGFVTTGWLLSAHGAWAELTLHHIGHERGSTES